MRATTDFPQRPRARSRVPLAVTAAVLMLVVTSLRGIAGFYTDFLWFDQLEINEVWRNVLTAKAALSIGFTLTFFAGLWASLRIADRFAPRLRSMDSEVATRYREVVGEHAGKVRLGVAALFALVAGSGVTMHWETWLLFRNSVPFGTNDPQFGRDISFFVFRLPFITFIVDWLFVALVIITVVTAVAYYLNGGIFISQGVQRVTPAVKAHLSVLLGLLALVKAADYWVQRFELSYSTNGHVLGLGYTDVQARLPALDLLVLISIAATLLFLANIRLKGFMLPVIAVGLWILVKVTVGGLYPWFKQSVQVQPNEAKLERPYIRRNIEATRRATGLDAVEVKDFPYDESLTAGDLSTNAETIRNVRLWDPKHTQSTFQRLQGLRAFYELADLDVDRYQLGAERQQTIVSVRELAGTLPAGNRSWVNTHLKYTHGFGAIVAPANAVTANGQPSFTLKDIPPVGVPDIEEPRIYFGEKTSGYAVVKTGEEEIDFLRDDGTTETTRYTGDGGVEVGSSLRRAAFALRFADVNLMLSKPVTATSRVMYVRSIGDRVRLAAPFLRYDSDPYPVLLDGKVVWVQDAYTVTDRYPYAQRADSDRLPASSGLHRQLNYVRNSVKVVIDAHDGGLTFYVTDDKDPLIKAYRKAFPKLFTDGDRMPAALREHLRYPEDLFRLQTNMYGRYHITDPGEFFQASDAWDVSQDPGSGPVRRSTDADRAAPAAARRAPAAGPSTIRVDRQDRMDPAYLLMKLPGEERTSFLLLQPFVPTSEGDKQQNLTSFMVAKSDPDDYGRLQVFVMPRGRQVAGPRQVASIIEAEETISGEVTVLNREGSRVIFGNLLLVPIEESLLYVRPLYTSSESNPLPELKQVIVVYGDNAVMRPTLQEALSVIFGEAPETLEEGDGGGPSAPGDDGPGATPAPEAGVQSLLDKAKSAFDEADAALKEGDLATFQRKIGEARAFIEQARQQQSATTSTTAPSSA